MADDWKTCLRDSDPESDHELASKSKRQKSRTSSKSSNSHSRTPAARSSRPIILQQKINLAQPDERTHTASRNDVNRRKRGRSPELSQREVALPRQGERATSDTCTQEQNRRKLKKLHVQEDDYNFEPCVDVPKVCAPRVIIPLGPSPDYSKKSNPVSIPANSNNKPRPAPESIQKNLTPGSFPTQTTANCEPMTSPEVRSRRSSKFAPNAIPRASNGPTKPLPTFEQLREAAADSVEKAIRIRQTLAFFERMNQNLNANRAGVGSVTVSAYDRPFSKLQARESNIVDRNGREDGFVAQRFVDLDSDAPDSKSVSSGFARKMKLPTSQIESVARSAVFIKPAKLTDSQGQDPSHSDRTRQINHRVTIADRHPPLSPANRVASIPECANLVPNPILQQEERLVEGNNPTWLEEALFGPPQSDETGMDSELTAVNQAYIDNTEWETNLSKPKTEIEKPKKKIPIKPIKTKKSLTAFGWQQVKVEDEIQLAEERAEQEAKQAKMFQAKLDQAAAETRLRVMLKSSRAQSKV